MKLDKSTKVLFNLVLILLIVFLCKLLISVPKDLYAQEKVEYKVVASATISSSATGIEKLLNQYSKQGWKFKSFGQSLFCIVFERQF